MGQGPDLARRKRRWKKKPAAAPASPAKLTAQRAQKSTLAALDEANLEYRRAKADAEKLKTAQLRGYLVPRARLAELLTLSGNETRKLFAALPRAIAPLLVGLEPREIEAKLDQHVTHILAQLARWAEAESLPKVRRGPGRPRKRSA